MARAIWRGAIQFGLVTIPLRLYLATESKGVSFNMLHASCLSRIQMKVYCPVHEQVINRSETVKGFEYAPDAYVAVTDEDLARVPLKTVRAIQIEQFVPADSGELMRFPKQSYYLEPEAVGRRAFSLLRSILDDAGLTAICKIVLRDREQLAALDPSGSTMLLTTLFWPDEIRSTADLDLPAADAGDVKPAERAMAEQLVAAMTGEFDAAAYRDTYREALQEIVEAKVAGAEVVGQPEPKAAGNLVDLMAALEASVAAARGAKATTPVRAVEEPAPRAARAARATRAARSRESQDAVEPPAAASAGRQARQRKTA
jgi:DNA end-binding protein Ku